LTPLTINVVPFKCTIDQQRNYDIMAGGRTLPIFFNFARCLPMSGVTLSGNVTHYTDKTLAAPAISFASSASTFSVDFKFEPNEKDPM
jgi:hypothetical protein